MGVTKLLSIPQFAKATGLGYRLARKLVLSGEVPSVKVGPRRRVDTRQIDKWLDWEDPADWAKVSERTDPVAVAGPARHPAAVAEER